MCPSLGKSGGCPKGDKCTYAHSEEERDRCVCVCVCAHVCVCVCVCVHVCVCDREGERVREERIP